MVNHGLCWAKFQDKPGFSTFQFVFRKKIPIFCMCVTIQQLNAAVTKYGSCIHSIQAVEMLGCENAHGVLLLLYVLDKINLEGMRGCKSVFSLCFSDLVLSFHIMNTYTNSPISII